MRNRSDCRAFSRRIEHACIRWLFETRGATAIMFDYSKTERNGPIHEFLSSLLDSGWESSPSRLTADVFEARRPALFHEIKVQG